jgi:aryl-alcohol dehydrogenase-like predicted oxidoreductase
MSDAYGKADRPESLATIRLAVDLGITLLDTADIYGGGENERLVGEAVRGRRDKVIIATKFGFRGNEHGELAVCGRPEYVHAACDASLGRLQTEVIDIYHLHRVDPEVPIAETVGAMAELVAMGKVRALALSEVSAATLRKAEKVHHIAALQSEYSLFTQVVEEEILPLCRANGTTLLAFSPLGRGFLTGTFTSQQQFEEGDYRQNLPRFSGDHLAHNLRLVDELKDIAAGKGITPGQLALAWLLHQGPGVLPLVGMKRRAYLQENLAAAQV